MRPEEWKSFDLVLLTDEFFDGCHGIVRRCEIPVAYHLPTHDRKPEFDLIEA